MNTKKEHRPENIIIGTDPVAIDIIQQIYSAIKDKNEADRTFQERCWVMGIEKAYKHEAKKLDPELCTKLLERIYFHLEHKNIWNVEENKLYEMFEKIISLKTLRDNRVQEVFNNLEHALSNVLQLDFSKKVDINTNLRDKRNIFNYIIFFFNSIIEKMEASMVSVKSMNAFFSLYPDVCVVVTDTDGKVRFINESGLKLFGQTNYMHSIGVEIKCFIEDYSKLMAIKKKAGAVIAHKTNIIVNKKSRPVKISLPKLAEDTSEIDEMVFVIQQ